MTEYSLTQTLLAALTAVLATVVGALVLMYPGAAVLLVGGAAAAWVVATVALRVRLTRRPARRLLLVRIPYTNLQLEV